MKRISLAFLHSVRFQASPLGGNFFGGEYTKEILRRINFLSYFMKEVGDNKVNERGNSAHGDEEGEEGCD